MDFKCNGSTCSELFDGVAVYVTACHAVVAAIFILSSLPLNILLITSMVVYRKMFDASVVLIIASLLSNIITSLFFTGGVFLTAAARAWLLGSLGCNVFAYLALTGSITRWTTVGFLSVDRFCRVFLPYFYPRHEKKVVLALLLISLVAAFSVPTMLIGVGRTGFDDTYPSCYAVPNSEASEIVQLLRTVGVEIAAAIFFSILPTVLYTALYCKGRKSNSNRVHVQPAVATENNQETNGVMAAKLRARKAVLTYFLLLASVNVVTVLAIIKLVVKILTSEYSASPSVSAALSYVITTGKDSYILCDIAILLTNQYHRSVLIKLMKRIKAILTTWP